LAGNALFFLQRAPTGARLDWPHAQLVQAGGFDHCYVLNSTSTAADAASSQPDVKQVACVYDPASGRQLTVFTDQRGLQFYTGNYLEGVVGRNGAKYARHAGMCLEAGAFPNEVNMEDQERVIVRPGTRYRQVTRYRVDVRRGA
jgi:aldose 1-epimerase